MFDLSKLDLGAIARGAAGVAIPALLGGLAGGGKGALLAGVSGLGGVLEADNKRDAKERQRAAERAAIEGVFGPKPGIGDARPGDPAGAPPNNLRNIMLGISQVGANSALAPVLQNEAASLLAADDPMTQAEQLRAQELQLSEQRMLREAEMQRQEQERAQQEQQRLAAMRESLPQSERMLFDIDPKGYAGQMIEARFPEPLTGSDRYRTVGTDLYDISGDSPVLAARGRRQNEPLEQVYDPETGLSSYVPRSEAAGGLVPPRGGITVGQDAEGNPIVQIGGSGQSASLGTKARNEVETDMVAMTAAMQRLDRIAESYRPEFNQYLPRINMAWDAIKSKAGVGLNPTESRDLQEFSKFRQSALENINLTIKEVTGAAMTDGEAKRIRATLPDPGQKVLDGDSPEEFQAKLNGAIGKTKMAYARLAYIRKNGLPLDGFGGISLDDMGGIVDQRGMAIEEQLRGAGLEGPELDRAVAQALREEFAL